MDIRVGCGGTRITWGRRGYSVSHMVLGLLEAVSFNGSLSFEIWAEIQGCEGVGMISSKVDGEDLEGTFIESRRALFG